MNNYTNPYLYVGLPPQNRRNIIRKMSAVHVNDLFLAIENALNITREDIISTSRKRQIVTARYIFFGLQKEYGGYMTLKKIGGLLNRHHSTVLYAIETFNDMVETKNKAFNIALNKVREELDKS